MNKNLLFLFLLLIGAKVGLAQSPSIQWQNCFGGSGTELLFPIKQDFSSNHFFAGATASNNGDVSGNHLGNCWPYACYDGWFVLVDNQGIIQYQKCLGGTKDDGFNGGRKLDNGHLILWGSTSSNDGDVSGNHMAGVPDAWIIEIDSTGSIYRQKCFGGTDMDSFNDLQITADSGFVLIGGARSTNGDVIGSHGGGEMWVVKLDSLWNIQWQKCLGGTGGESGYNIYPTNDLGYFCVGASNSFDGDITNPKGGLDYWIVKIDSVGNKQWDRSFGGTQGDSSPKSCMGADSMYYLLGYSSSHDGDVQGNHDLVLGLNDYWLCKVDGNGNLVWGKCFGGTGYDYGTSVIADSFGNIILGGFTCSSDGDVTGIHFGGGGCFPSACSDIWLLQIDTSGSILWQNCFGGSSGEQLYALALTNDNNYIVGGLTDSYDGDVSGSIYHGNGDAWIFRLSTIFASVSESRKTITDFTCHLSSNQEKLTLQFFADSREKVVVSLLDITGRVVMQKDFETTSGLNKNEIRTGPLSNGIYLVRLETAQGTVTKKVAISR